MMASKATRRCFGQAFEKACGLKRDVMEPLFLQYYGTDYAHIGERLCAVLIWQALVHLLQEKGYGIGGSHQSAGAADCQPGASTLGWRA